MATSTAEQAISARDARRTKVEELSGRLAEAEKQERMLAHRRRELLLPVELNDATAREELAELGPELEAACRVEADLRDTLSAAEASLAQLAHGVRTAQLEERSVEYEQLLDQREKASRALERALDKLIETIEAWNALHTLTVGMGAQLGLADVDLRPLHLARHLQGALAGVFWQYLPELSRPHQQLRQPFSAMDRGQVDIARRGAERVRRRLEKRQPQEEPETANVVY